MTAYEKPTIDQYPAWTLEILKVAIDGGTARAYTINAQAALITCEEHPFFRMLDATLRSAADEYFKNTCSKLFISEAPSVGLKTKPYDSALNKSFRLNVVWNRNYPKQPKNGWVEPARWFQAMDDLVRGVLVCRYLDGPEFVAEQLRRAAVALGLRAEYRPVHLDYGYYAYHFYVAIPFLLTRADWTTEQIEVQAEIQLTTQLQDVVRDMTHRSYEVLRLQDRTGKRDDGKWKWDYESARFKSSYLSHTLHMLEGLISELRTQAAGNSANEERDDDGSAAAPEPAGALPADDPPEDSSR